MIPPEMRLKRSKKILAQAPVGQTWCAGCQSFRDLVDFGKGQTQCRPCASGKAHATMIAKTYGLDADGYRALLALQGGRCAICRARPRSKRLAVDHDHKSGAVRGLLCSRCNHDLMGSAWDSLALVAALWHYLNTPPAFGDWRAPEDAPTIGVLDDVGKAVANASEFARPSDAPKKGASAPPRQAGTVAEGECERPHTIPVGAEAVPGKRGVWRYWVEPDSDPPF